MKTFHDSLSLDLDIQKAKRRKMRLLAAKLWFTQREDKTVLRLISASCPKKEFKFGPWNLEICPGHYWRVVLIIESVSEFPVGSERQRSSPMLFIASFNCTRSDLGIIAIGHSDQ
jgi:hypothetical protein